MSRLRPTSSRPRRGARASRAALALLAWLAALAAAAEPPAPPPRPAPDLAVERLELSARPIDRARTSVRVRVRNLGTAAAPATGLIVECTVTVGAATRNCPGSNPPARFPLPRLAPGAARDFELPLRRFLLPPGQRGAYTVKAVADTRLRAAEPDRYNNVRELQFTH